MVDQRLANYIESQLSRDVPIEQIKRSLLSQGWPDHDINEAINLSQRDTPPQKQTATEKNRILAGLAYLLLFLGWIGLIANLVIYYSTKNKYAKFHAGQACFLVLVLNIIMLVAFFGIFGTFSLIPMGFPTSTSVYSSIFIVGVVVALLYISLAIAAFLGKDFRIPIAAHLLEK